MTDFVSVVMPFVVICLWPVGYFLGRRVRGIAHVYVPFKDPVSLTVLTLACLVMVYPFWRLAADISDPVGIWPLSSGLGFLIGYMIGYCSIQIDIVQVAVHNITEHDMDCYPLVYYYSPEGRLCWQPQGFKDVVKSMIFNVHNPLQLPLGSIYRKRHLHLKTPMMIRQDVDVVDLAGIEVNEYEVTKAHIKFHVEARKYIPSPNCTDAPYDWIVRAQEYEDVFVSYSEMQVEAIESPFDRPFAYAGIYAQAYALVRQGFRWWSDTADIRRMNRRNERFEMKSVEEELITTWYRPPREGEPYRLLTSADVLQRLSGMVRVPLSKNNIGRVLRKLGYKVHRVRGMSKYHMIELTSQEVNVVRNS